MVLDSSVVVAIFLREPRAEELIERIQNAEFVFIAAPSLVECVMVLSSRLPRDMRGSVMDVLRRMNVEVVPFTQDHQEAAMEAFLRFGRGRHPAALNFGDCLAYATAAVAGLPLLYTGNDLRKAGM